MKKRTCQKYEIICQTCGDRFLVGNWRKSTAKFCSKQCHNDRSVYYLECSKCGKQFRRTEWQKSFYKGSYCSKQCYENREDEIIVSCDGCKTDVRIFPCQQKYYDKHYCSNKCRIKFGPIGKLTDTDIIDSNYYRFVRKVRHCERYYAWRNQVRESENYKCAKCNATKYLTVHHKGVSMYEFVKKHGFDLESIYADPKFFDVKNGQLLCRGCHAKEHRK